MTDETGPDYDDPEVEEAWCEARREEVAQHLARQQLNHGRVGEWPAWHVAPVVSIWAIESGTTPGAMGWWVICGDLPTDCIAADEAADPREAAGAFAARWLAASAELKEGRNSPGLEIGSTPDERRSLAPMLQSRASLLGDWAERDDLWD